MEDKNGFIWIAGVKGLQRFDGNNFKDYFHDPKDSLSLPFNNINHLLYDEENNQIWIAFWKTGFGLSVFDLSTEKFKNYINLEENSPRISGKGLYWSFKDKFGNFWISVATKGLVKYLPESDNFEPHPYQHLSTKSELNFNPVNRFVCKTQDLSNDSLLWIGTLKGLLKFNVVNGQFERFSLALSDQSNLSIQSILYHEDNQIYIGTFLNELFKFNTRTEKFIKCNLGEHVKKGFSNIESITAKSKTQLWLTREKGMLTYDIKKNKVIKSRLNDLPNNKLYGVKYEGKKERKLVWKGNHFFIYDPKRQQIKPYRYISKKDDFSNRIIKILEDDKTGDIWIGSHVSEGLYRLNLATSEWEVFPPPKSYFDKKTAFYCHDILKTKTGEILVLETNTIYKLLEKENRLVPWEIQPKVKGVLFRRIIADSRGNIWIGSTQEGIFKINPIEKSVRQYKKELSDPDKLNPGNVWDLKEDKKGNIWIRGNGYSVYDVRRDTFFNFPHFFPDKKNVEHIQSLGIDGEGNVWIASHLGSIGITDANHPENGIVEYFDTNNGLRTLKPIQFLLDNEKKVWIASNALEVVGPKRTYSQYFMSSYLLNETFLSISQLSDGKIAVGFREGLGIFHPDSLQIIEEPPKPYIRSFKVFDKELETELPLYKTKDIYLNPNQNFFSIEISAINPSYFGKLGFLYQLEGVDHDWVDPGERNYIAYTDVKSGIYNFILRAKNSEGFWNKTPYVLRIHIATPWYRTWWAYSFAVLLVMGLAVSLYRFQLNRKMEKAEAVRLKELNAVKTMLYTNITHEFRTPLTIISGMTDQINDNPKEWYKEGLKMIKRNSNRLLNLVNQMLDLSKLENAEMTLKLVQGDIVNYLKYLVKSFHSYAESEKIQLHFLSDVKELNMDYDVERLQQVVTNLLSNAVKFTPEGGHIYISVRTEFTLENVALEKILIKIKDTGIGIPEDQIEYVFDRFYQVDDSMTRQSDGSGIGLALTNELVKLIEGEILVESEHGEGTEFTIVLPVRNEAIVADPLDIGENQSVENIFAKASPVYKKYESVKKESKTSALSTTKPQILLIEDNPDVVAYVASFLEKDYQIKVGKDGQEGIEIALNNIPDLIISDVMMPYKDGFEVCETLKNDERTSHIPIIMLTAKADIQSKLEGLEHGADAYLPKPFHKEELLLRIKKLLELRQKLQQHYLSLVGFLEIAEPKEVPNVDQIEDYFVIKARKAVEAHLSDFDFNVEILCKELILSHSQVHRKLSALTGFSANKFIRYVRLNKAKELLQDSELSILSISFDTGFNDPNYFGRVFRKEFGKTPTQWREEMAIEE